MIRDSRFVIALGFRSFTITKHKARIVNRKAAGLACAFAIFFSLKLSGSVSRGVCGDGGSWMVVAVIDLVRVERLPGMTRCSAY